MLENDNCPNGNDEGPSENDDQRASEQYLENQRIDLASSRISRERPLQDQNINSIIACYSGFAASYTAISAELVDLFRRQIDLLTELRNETSCETVIAGLECMEKDLGQYERANSWRDEFEANQIELYRRTELALEKIRGTEGEGDSSSELEGG